MLTILPGASTRAVSEPRHRLCNAASVGALRWCEGCQGSALEAGKRRGLELAEGSGARAGQTHRANGEEPPGKPDGRPRRLDDGVLF